jgi:single-strand DNA-binding protein
MNKVVLIGRATKDPELKFTPGDGKAVATFVLAVDRRFANKEGKRDADFIPIVVWGKPAEAVANYSGKGKMLGVSGRIQTRSYDNKEGKKVYVTEVIADEVQILEWVKGNTSSSNVSNNEYGPDITPIDDGEDIPF